MSRSITSHLILATALLFGVGEVRAQDVRVARADLMRNLEEQASLDAAQVAQLLAAFDLPASGTITGARFQLVRTAAGHPVYRVTHNLAAALGAGVLGVRAGGWVGTDLEGGGLVVGVWDADTALPQHVEFGTRIRVVDAGSSPASHATHVTGTVAAFGVRAEAMGMAPAVLIDAYDWQNDRVEMATAGAGGLLVSNHSYGTFGGWVEDLRGTGRWTWMGDTSVNQNEDYRYGFYGEEAAAWDAIAYASPNHVIVKSAGNERADRGPTPGTPHDIFVRSGWATSTAQRPPDGGKDGYDSILDAGLGKNVLTVGAVEDLTGFFPEPEDVRMTTFSGWGPADDGRIKPDIVANGTSVWSSVAGSPDAYAYSSGTSMAAPVVAGAVALTQEAYLDLYGVPPSAATVRALIIHSARESGPHFGPDYQFGWGLIDVGAAVSFLLESEAKGTLITGTLLPGQSVSYTTELLPLTELSATLAWTDPPAPESSPALNARASVLVNDLDLSVTGPDGVFLPFRLDPNNPSDAATSGRNNVDTAERVNQQQVQGGTYEVRVTLAPAAVSSQSFSLLIGPAHTGGQPGQTVSGRLMLAGHPAGGVKVSAADREAISAVDGTFHLPGLPAGTVSIAPEQGFGFQPESITVELPSTEWIEFTAPSLLRADGIQLFSTPNLLREGEGDSIEVVTSTASGGVYGLNVFLSSDVDLNGARVSLDFDSGFLAQSYAGSRASQFLALDPNWRAKQVAPGRFVKRVPLFWQMPDIAPQTVRVPMLVYDSGDRLVGVDTLRWQVTRADDVPPIIYPRINVAGRGLSLPGNEIIIRADVLDGSPIARVGARFVDRDSGNFLAHATLHDDGAWARHGDALAGDRLYGTIFSTGVEADMRIDMEAEDALGNTVIQTGAWHISSRPFVPTHRYLLLTWSQSDADTDAHRTALQDAGIDHDYWEFAVRGQFPDTLLAHYDGVLWSWNDRVLDRPSDRTLFEKAILGSTPIALLGLRVDQDNWLDPLVGIRRTGSVWANQAEGAPGDSVFAGTQTNVEPGPIPIWQGGSAALLFGGEVVAVRSGSTLISGISPLRLPENGRAEFLRRVLYAITGDQNLSTSPTSSEQGAPSPAFGLSIPYPNPASTAALLAFSLPSPGPVRLDAHDILGRKVASIWEGFLDTGAHQQTWDLDHLPAGVYFVSLSAGGQRETAHLVVTRE
jgi:subtilisin family serine protease